MLIVTLDYIRTPSYCHSSPPRCFPRCHHAICAPNRVAKALKLSLLKEVDMLAEVDMHANFVPPCA